MRYLPELDWLVPPAGAGAAQPAATTTVKIMIVRMEKSLVRCFIFIVPPNGSLKKMVAKW